MKGFSLFYWRGIGLINLVVQDSPYEGIKMRDFSQFSPRTFLFDLLRAYVPSRWNYPFLAGGIPTG